MRLLTVSHFYEAHGGGIERVAGHLCRHFAALGVESVWAASDQDAAPVGSIETVPLGCVNPTEALTGLPMPIPGWRGACALSREIARADAVVVHDALYVTSILAMVIAKSRGKRVLLIQHIAAIPFASRLLRGVMALANFLVTYPMMWAADELVFVSDTVREELLGSPARRAYRLIFNGVDSTVFHPAMPRVAARSPEGTRRVLFVGRYVEKKGLAVIRALARKRSDLSFVLAGSGPIHPADWGLANVHDLGPQTPAELAALYADADLLLLPSVGEGYPLVVQEAMACGLPVVCGTPSHRADPHAARWLRAVAVDLTHPEVSALACAAAIDGLALSAPERAEMASYAAQTYSWRTMATAVLDGARGSAG